MFLKEHTIKENRRKFKLDKPTQSRSEEQRKTLAK